MTNTGNESNDTEHPEVVAWKYETRHRYDGEPVNDWETAVNDTHPYDVGGFEESEKIEFRSITPLIEAPDEIKQSIKAETNQEET